MAMALNGSSEIYYEAWLDHDYRPPLWGRRVDLVSSFVASTSRTA